ncbi:zinc-ribbon domain-containing protein [Candidatus Pelagibacter sp.]|nr:zinc-ribbon domain-containing protein [Candidatus Pelagibacter sp.]
MIISCSNCNKQFKINPSLIPDNGRDVKCGSCDHVWFYKIEDDKTEPLPLSDNFTDKKIGDEIDNKIVDDINKPNDVSLEKEIDDRIDKIEDKIPEKQKPVKNKIKKNTSGKFFSYLVVSIISFVGLIILIDTLKVPLINIFPGLEILLFNLFEILKDIKLFIIDLY